MFHHSSFWGLPYRILNINHNKELLWSLWVSPSRASTDSRVCHCFLVPAVAKGRLSLGLRAIGCMTHNRAAWTSFKMAACVFYSLSLCFSSLSLCIYIYIYRHTYKAIESKIQNPQVANLNSKTLNSAPRLWPRRSQFASWKPRSQGTRP